MRGARVAVLEARMSRELGRLVERYGGVPLCAPALREITSNDEDAIAHLVDGLSSGAFDAIVLLTGVSVTRLVEGAERIGRRAELVAGLKRVTTICRGPKPAAALRAVSVAAAVCAREPFTTAELLDAIAPLHATHRRFALIHYGDRNDVLAETLRARDAEVQEISLYTWDKPEDLAPLRDLVFELIAGSVDAVAFTCQIHVSHLFQVAADLDQKAALVEALNERVVVAAVGPRCRAALESRGVQAHVVPENPKLGPMVAALARHLERLPRR
jgi:uroporphyrinogen-III synthase